jgi:hypothetical protein
VRDDSPWIRGKQDVVLYEAKFCLSGGRFGLGASGIEESTTKCLNLAFGIDDCRGFSNLVSNSRSTETHRLHLSMRFQIWW